MRYVAYNTADPNAELMKYGEVKKEKEVVIGGLQTDRAEKITGSAYSEQVGTVFVEQTFDFHVGEGNTEEGHWDVTKEFKLEAKKAQSFEVQIIAPRARVRFVNGTTDTKEIRIFARAWEGP